MWTLHGAAKKINFSETTKANSILQSMIYISSSFRYLTQVGSLWGIQVISRIKDSNRALLLRDPTIEGQNKERNASKKNLENNFSSTRAQDGSSQNWRTILSYFKFIIFSLQGFTCLSIVCLILFVQTASNDILKLALTWQSPAPTRAKIQSLTLTVAWSHGTKQPT